MINNSNSNFIWKLINYIDLIIFIYLIIFIMYTIPLINHDHHFNISNKSIFKFFISVILYHVWTKVTYVVLHMNLVS